MLSLSELPDRKYYRWVNEWLGDALEASWHFDPIWGREKWYPAFGGTSQGDQLSPTASNSNSWHSNVASSQQYWPITYGAPNWPPYWGHFGGGTALSWPPDPKNKEALDFLNQKRAEVTRDRIGGGNRSPILKYQKLTNQKKKKSSSNR